MKISTAAMLVGATVALLLVASPVSAQISVSDAPRWIEIADDNLPDAPLPQTDVQSAPASTTQALPPQAPTGTSASSQDTASPSTTPQTAPPDPDAKRKQHDEAERELKVQEKQRLLGVMPQFQVVMGGQAVPLTGGEKWRLALHSAIDPFYIGWAFVIGGGWGEVVDSDKGYGWGDAGYFKRVGANYADNVNGALIGNALLPQILHQDPRYFRQGTGSFKSRFIHAALSTVVCHGDNGKNQPNVSNVLGNYISGAISNLYYPSNERGVLLTLENGTSVTLFGALGGQILEFGPDISRLLHRRKTAEIPPASPLVPPAAAPTSPPNQAPPSDPR